MDENPAKQNLLPLSVAAIFLAGFVLIVAGVIVHFVGHPETGAGSFWLYEILMGAGASCELLGAWLAWRWRKGQRSRTR